MCAAMILGQVDELWQVRITGKTEGGMEKKSLPVRISLLQQPSRTTHAFQKKLPSPNLKLFLML